MRGIYCIYATLVFFALYGWLSGLLVEMRLCVCVCVCVVCVCVVCVCVCLCGVCVCVCVCCPKHVEKLK